MIPQTGNMYVRGEPLSFFHDYERVMIPFNQELACILAKNCSDAPNDPWIYPNLMDESLVAKLPPAIIYTTEFDMFRRNAEETRDLLAKYDKVLDFGVLRGMFHEAYAFYDLKRSDVWFRDIARAISKYF